MGRFLLLGRGGWTGPKTVLLCNCSETESPFGKIPWGWRRDNCERAPEGAIRRFHRLEIRPSSRVATGPAISDILSSGGWRQARASPTGSGPEGSSPNERFAG